MSDRRDPSGYNIRLTATPPTAVVPAVSKLSTTANLADGASVDLEFQIDSVPLLDMILSSDRDLTIQTFVRIDENDTFRQVDNDIPYVADVKYARILGTNSDGHRIPGTLFRIRITNSSGVATTRLLAQAIARSS